jgi:hypothetical protein
LGGLKMSIANTILDERAKEPLKDKLNRWLDVLNYWFEHIEEYGDRYPDMKEMVDEFDQTIEEMYNLLKEL